MPLQPRDLFNIFTPSGAVYPTPELLEAYTRLYSVDAAHPPGPGTSQQQRDVTPNRIRMRRTPGEWSYYEESSPDPILPLPRAASPVMELTEDEYESLRESFEASEQQRTEPMPAQLKWRDFRATIKSALKDPASDETEKKLTRLVNALAKNKHPVDYRSAGVIREARLKVLNLLRRNSEPDTWFYCEGTNNIIIHRSRVVECYGTYYSRFYFNRNGTQCSHCHCNMLIRNMTRGPEGEPLCRICQERYRRRGSDENPVMCYSTNVVQVLKSFLRTPEEERQDKNIQKPRMYYGVELEVVSKKHGRKDAAVCARNAFNDFAILKNDASIGDDGFEIVTVPATLEYHRKSGWNKFFDTPVGPGAKSRPAAQMVKSWGTNTCGLHIHVSREPFSKMQLGKFLTFFHNPDNRDFLSKIAGRDVSPNARWCKQAKKKLGLSSVVVGDVAQRTKVGLVAKSGSPPVSFVSSANGRYDEAADHHATVNISQRNGGKTVEVRIFRGNVTRHGVMRALDFVAAIADWCGQSSAGSIVFNKDFISGGPNIKPIDGQSPTAFLIWFSEPQNRCRFPDLWKQLISLGFIGTGHKLGVYNKETKTFTQVLPKGEEAEVA